MGGDGRCREQQANEAEDFEVFTGEFSKELRQSLWKARYILWECDHTAHMISRSYW